MWGLYFEYSIIPIYIILGIIYIGYKILKNVKEKIKNTNTNEKENKSKDNKKFKTFTFKRHFRYIKLIFNIQIIAVAIVSSIISNSIIIFQNKKYENLYKENQQLNNIIGIVESNLKQTDYYNIYIVRIQSIDNNDIYNNTHVYINIDKKSSLEIKYGDKISFDGKYIKPEIQRNTGGFNYSQYLKTLKIYGTIKVSGIALIEENKGNSIASKINYFSEYLKQKNNEIFSKQTSNMLNGLILGDTSGIEEEIKEDFKSANISHILAISGMHISYLIILFESILYKLFGKRKSRYIIIILLIIYMAITGFSASIVRAGSMGILLIISKLIYSKNDFFNSLSLSLLLILIYNPFLILNQGLQFSYIATIGIVILYPIIINIFNICINKYIEKHKHINVNKNNYIITKVKEILGVTISAQIGILPVMIYNFNIFNTYFIISNFLVGIIIGSIIILSFIFLVISIIWTDIVIYFSYIIEISINLLVRISNIGNLPFSQIYIKTPSMLEILIYFCILVILKILHDVYLGSKSNYSKNRIKNYISYLKYMYSINRKKVHISIILILIILILLNFIPKKLQINFIDVGQGDSTFIITPQNKTILIDGGGSSTFNVGENTLIPYILDKGYTKIDYIFVTHFDTDHVGGIIEVADKLKVENIFISEQIEISENYKELEEIVNRENINMEILRKGDKVNIEKDIYFNILWPEEKQIEENVLNNNSLVMKMYYKEFSMLFTGDIEKIAEEELIGSVLNKKIFESTVLKVAHHGSKTSTIESFLEAVKPKIALIGVGKNNLFGHPNSDVIARLEEKEVQIFRTDLNGEISLEVYNGEIFIKKKIN